MRQNYCGEQFASFGAQVGTGVGGLPPRTVGVALGSFVGVTASFVAVGVTRGVRVAVAAVVGAAVAGDSVGVSDGAGVADGVRFGVGV